MSHNGHINGGCGDRVGGMFLQGVTNGVELKENNLTGVGSCLMSVPCATI